MNDSYQLVTHENEGKDLDLIDRLPDENKRAIDKRNVRYDVRTDQWYEKMENGKIYKLYTGKYD